MKRITLMFLMMLGISALEIQAQMLPYQDASLSPSQRANDLLHRLTLDEKVGLMMD